jgi:hypothetical protein
VLTKHNTMDIRKKFRFNIFLIVLATITVAILGTILTILEHRFSVCIAIASLTVIAIIMLINHIVVQIELLDKISYNQGLETYRNKQRAN